MIRCQEKVFANIVKLQSDQREYGQRQSNQMDADRICKRSEEKLTAALNYIQSKKKEPEKSQKFRRAQVDYNQVSLWKIVQLFGDFKYFGQGYLINVSYR